MNRRITGVPTRAVINSDSNARVELFEHSKFYFGSDCCSLEELGEYFTQLGNKSWFRKSESSQNAIKSEYEFCAQLGMYLSGAPAEYIFMLSEHWRLHDEVKYLALEIFNKFMTSLISQLHKLIHDKFPESSTSSSSDNSSAMTHVAPGPFISPRGRPKKTTVGDDDILRASSRNAWIKSRESKKMMSDTANKEWKRTLSHLKRQTELRAVTCIMIASKISSHYDIITLSKAVEFLRKCGHRYSKDVIVKSELRVLKTINYDFHSLPTLHPYITVMLEILARSDLSLPVEQFYPICVHLLDLFYHFRPFIFARLCKVQVDESGMLQLAAQGESSKVFEAMNDMLLPSAAVIASAVYVKNKVMSDQVIIMLSKMIGAKDLEITEFSYVILDVVLTSDR